MLSPEGSKPPLIVLLGPTAVGKTALSIQLARRVGAEIISADSRLLYRGMDIGTAKPTPGERALVPHHLIDVVEPDQTWSLAWFRQEVDRLVRQISRRGRLSLMVGGTGQYIRAVVEGWEIPKGDPDPRLRSVLARWGDAVGSAGLHARLARLDPAAASKIDPQNLRRIIRALEVILTTGVRFSAQRRRSPPPYRCLLLGLTRPRPELYARIDNRIDAMLAAGLLQEVQALLERGLSPDLPSLSAIGYREMVAHLQGELSLEEAVKKMKRRTRQFVRRQANWFKADDPRILWLEVGDGTLDALEMAVREFCRSGSNLADQ